MKKLTIIKILSFLFIILFLGVLFTIPIKANSYNYDDKLNPINSPYAYNFAKELNLNKIANEPNLKLEFVESAKRYDEIYVVGFDSTTKEGILLVFNQDYKLKKKFFKDSKLPLPLQPTSISYSSGKLFISSGRDEEVFSKDFYNPITNEIIAREYDILTNEISTKINEVKKILDKNKQEQFDEELKKIIRKECKIFIYNRFDINNKLFNDDIIFEYEHKFGLKSREAVVLNKPFRPVKLASHNNSSLLYCISEGSQIGLLCFRKDGTFIKFIGSNKVELSNIDKFWRKFINEQVLDELDQKIQANFSSITVDEAGFIYTVTDNIAVSKANQVQKFNAKGKNILLQDSNRPVVGDYYKNPVSRTFFSLVDVSHFGTYLLFDRVQKRIFSYNNTGELLFSQGEIGNNKHQFNNVIDMKFFNEDILIMERATNKNTIKIMTPTKYGSLLNKASLNYHHGNFNFSSKIYDEIINLNNNSDFAHIGKGKIHMLNKDYEKACKEFKIANQGEFYAEAYEKYRAKRITELFPLGLAALFLLINISISYRIYFRKEKNEK